MNFQNFQVLFSYIVKYHDMNRASLIERIEEARTVLESLLILLKSAPPEPDRFVSHLYQSGRECRPTCDVTEIRQANRAVSRVPRREDGLQARVSPMETPAADPRLIAVISHDANLHRKNRGASSTVAPDCPRFMAILTDFNSS